MRIKGKSSPESMSLRPLQFHKKRQWKQVSQDRKYISITLGGNYATGERQPSK